MSDRSALWTHRNLAGLCAWCLFVLATAGCQMYSNPFTDPYAGLGPVTTPSSIEAFAVKKEPRAAERSFSSMTVSPSDESVTHGPLYFEDGLGEASEDDGQFAWTGADYLNIFTWRARFLLNLGLFPISVVDTPPWCTMSSDGRPSRRVLGIDHDAKKVDEPGCCCHEHVGSS
jgi:hypothetical protein